MAYKLYKDCFISLVSFTSWTTNPLCSSINYCFTKATCYCTYYLINIYLRSFP